MNIGLHLIGFYFGNDLYSVLSSLVICELLLMSFYFFITVCKWIVSDFHKIQTEQVNLSSQISKSHNGTNERIEKLENDILDRIIISEEKNINTILSQKESLLEAINLLKEQTNLSNDEIKKVLKFIESFLEKIEKLSEESVNTSSKNNEDLKKINLTVNEKASELNAEFSKVHTDSNSILKVIQDNNQIATNNSDELKTIITKVNEEANKVSKNTSQIMTSKYLELNNRVDEILKTLESFKTKIAQENSRKTSEIKSLEEIILREVNTVMKNLNSSKLERNKALGTIGSNIKQSKSELDTSIQKHISTSYVNQKNHIDFKLKNELNVLYDRLDALISIHEIIKPIAPLPIMHDWRVSSDYAYSMIIHLLENKGSAIDIGSGISTVLLGYVAKQNNRGKIVSLEHDKKYYNKTLELIKLHQLENWCHLYYCPLKDYTINSEKWVWYDISQVDFPSDVTLISVDGPPGNTQPLSRYPALPLLKDIITTKTSIYLDDGDREDEKKIVDLWSQQMNLTSEFITTNKGAFKLVKI